MNSHGHQTRNKYILLCCLRYLLFSSTKFSHLYNNLFQQTIIPVSVFFTTSFTQQKQLRSIPSISTVSSLIYPSLYLRQSCRRYQNQPRSFLHSNSSTVLAESYRKSTPVQIIQLIPLPRSNHQPLSQRTFIQQPHSPTKLSTHSNHQFGSFSVKSPSTLELTFLCQRLQSQAPKLRVTEYVQKFTLIVHPKSQSTKHQSK
jgi:hypothetical protein